MKITMIQKYDRHDHDWDDCQYFKVDGKEFPTCVMINDTDEYVLSLRNKKLAAETEMRTIINDHPNYKHCYGLSELDYNFFKERSR